VAHEIKNPLTPIALSAERISKHLDAASRTRLHYPQMQRGNSGLRGTLRTLVAQFSALAEFPRRRARLRHQSVTEEALALFAGRLNASPCSSIWSRVCRPCWLIRKPFAAPGEPHRQRRRGHAGSLLRVLGLRSSLSEDGASSRSRSPIPATASR